MKPEEFNSFLIDLPLTQKQFISEIGGGGYDLSSFFLVNSIIIPIHCSTSVLCIVYWLKEGNIEVEISEKHAIVLERAKLVVIQ